MNRGKIKTKNLVIFLILLIGFSIGTVSHIIDIEKFGFFGYKFAPYPLNVFWTFLVILDPLTIILIFFKLRYAIYLAISIMMLDITINLSYGITSGQIPILLGLLSQIPFGIFVFSISVDVLKYDTITNFLSQKSS